jgi:CspA family cold shock protein
MRSAGQVREWHAGEGWAVIDCPETPGGCWAHFSTVLISGYKSLTPGADVALVFEAAEQDGYSSRAVEVWPAGRTPVRTPQNSESSAAYSSTLRFTFDSDDAAST